jgi:hypothetical protein
VVKAVRATVTRRPSFPRPVIEPVPDQAFGKSGIEKAGTVRSLLTFNAGTH